MITKAKCRLDTDWWFAHDRTSSISYISFYCTMIYIYYKSSVICTISVQNMYAFLKVVHQLNMETNLYAYLKF